MNKKYFKYYCMTARRSCQPFRHDQVLWSFSNRDHVKALHTQTRTFLEPHIFYFYFWFPNSLVSRERIKGRFI